MSRRVICEGRNDLWLQILCHAQILSRNLNHNFWNYSNELVCLLAIIKKNKKKNNQHLMFQRCAERFSFLVLHSRCPAAFPFLFTSNHPWGEFALLPLRLQTRYAVPDKLGLNFTVPTELHFVFNFLFMSCFFCMYRRSWLTTFCRPLCRNVHVHPESMSMRY